MPHLKLSLLGPFSASLDSQPLAGFRTKAVQALLIYLVCQPEQTHRREYLMTLLWPGLPQKSAQANLRQIIYLLRQTIAQVNAKDEENPVPFLLVDRQAVQVNPQVTYDLDVAEFEKFLTGPAERWVEAVALYRGDFLADFYLPDSAPFEEWVLARREGLRRKVLEALDVLIGRAIEVADTGTAEGYARRQIEIDNLRESGHRQLMETLALSGRRTEVLAHYDTLRLLLEKELGAEPSAETIELYERVLGDRLASGRRLTADSRRQLVDRGTEVVKKPKLPAFLKEMSAEERAPLVFVGRERELSWLDNQLSLVLQNQGGVAFVSGDAGSGKSTLLRAFARQASVANPDMLVAWGACNAFSGSGDPYLPFRDILNALTGDVEGPWSAGTLTREQAQALWLAMPEVIQAILEHGPDLLDTFIPRTALANRISDSDTAGNTLQTQLQQGMNNNKTPSGELEQPQLFEQLSNVLHRLAKDHPLLLLLDDLQWADSGSINLLFHLGRRMAGGRILVVGSYRPEEISAGRNDKQHPLQPILDEFKRIFGDVWLDLNQASSREFVDAFLDSENNRLGEEFRKTLFGRTQGHPLFTVELLRDLQERGDLIQDDEGYWIAGPELNWESLPARIEGVIAARIGRLEDELREILNVAAVEGETFTAQVVARIQQLQERGLLRTLSQELEKRHRLVYERSTQQVDQRLLSRYRFAHALFQRYLYNELSAGERRLLHGEIAAILEELHAGHTAEKVVQLARHYLEAGKSGKALHYLLQAGDEARRLYAFEDASRHYEQALDILKRKGDYEGASRILMKMGLTYYGAVDFNRSQRAYRDAFMLLRQADLSLQMNLPAPPHPLRITMPSIITLDPIMITDTKSEIVASQLFGRLLNRTPDLNVMPDIAESWEILEDGRTFLFHLRDNVVWSDGQPLTAEDFVFAMHLQLEPGIATAYPEYWDEVQGAAAYRHGEGQASDLGIEALDPFTLKVRLVHPSGPFLQLLVYLVPLPRHAIEIHGQDWTEPGKLVTSGPFLLDSWKKERSLVLKRNPAYYGQFSGNVDQVELLMYSKPEEYLEAYQADELDILPLSQMGPANMSRAIYEHAADYVTFPDFTTERLTFNTVRPPFDDVRVRRALVLAIDRQKLTEIAEKGLNSPATGGLIPEGLPGHLADTALPYDPERAQQLLAEAGYPNGRDLPRVTGFISKFNEHLPEFLNKYWKDNLELQVVWKILDWDTFVEYDKGNQQYHMYLGAWSADHPDPDTFLRVLMQVARSYWPNETYYEIAETARHTMDHNKRMHLYQQAEEILLEEAPIMPLFYLREHLLIKPWIKNYRFRTMGQAYWKDIIIEPH